MRMAQILSNFVLTSNDLHWMNNFVACWGWVGALLRDLQFQPKDNHNVSHVLLNIMASSSHAQNGLQKTRTLRV